MSDGGDSLSVFVGRRGTRYSTPAEWRELILTGALRRDDDVAFRRGDGPLNRTLARGVPELQALFDEIEGPEPPPWPAEPPPWPGDAPLPQRRPEPVPESLHAAPAEPEPAPPQLPPLEPAPTGGVPVRVNVRSRRRELETSAAPTPLTYALTPLRKYATFDGRAGRPEFWWYVAAWFAVFGALNAIDAEGAAGAFFFATLIPSLAVGARRLHDTGRSASWLFLHAVPFIGLLLAFFYAQPGDDEENQYGSPPRPPD